jgi:LysR family hydrogen peroxide-inducible transcriptional activator
LPIDVRESPVSRPSVKQIEYFVAVARQGSFRRAAESLDVSQPTVTSQVALLEKSLGVVLFERGRSGATLSPAGRELLPRARSVLDCLDELVETAGSAGSGAAVYRLGVKSTLGPYLLPRILPALHAKHPDLKLYVREESPDLLESGLEQGELDLIMTGFPTNSADLDGETLLREDIKLVLPAQHPLAGKAKVSGEDLAGEQILTTGDGHHLTRLVEQVSARFGAQVLRDYQGTSLDALRLMVVTGMGLTFLPALYIDSEINADSALAVREIEGHSIARIIGMAWRRNSPSRVFYRKLAADLRQMLRTEVGSAVTVMDVRS